MKKDKFLKKCRDMNTEIQEHYQEIEVLQSKKRRHLESCPHPEEYRERPEIDMKGTSTQTFGTQSEDSKCQICGAVVSIHWPDAR